MYFSTNLKLDLLLSAESVMINLSLFSCNNHIASLIGGILVLMVM